MAEETKLTRIKASDDKPKQPASTTSKKVAPDIKRTKKPKRNLLRPLIAIGEYFKGAWYELRQVRWPTRRATWGLTLAVLLFSAFFVVLIVLLDLLFQFLFEQLIK